MAGIFSRLRLKRTRGRGKSVEPGRADSAFKARYGGFKALLESNSELLTIIADMELKLRGQTPFGMGYVRSRASRIAFHCARMVSGFKALSGNRYPALAAKAQSLGRELSAQAGPRKFAMSGGMVLPFADVDKDMGDLVGGKNANLGEMTRAGLPVPQGFAITTAAFEAVLENADLTSEVRKRMLELDDPEDAALVGQVSERVQNLFLTAPLPDDLEQAILDAHREVSRAVGRDDAPVAMRSSAIGEDGDLSFAGQYLSVLGVSRRRLLHTYRLILASLFTPRAISYRLHKGVPLDEISMAVACLEMVESRASGVMYSRHPFRAGDDSVLINAVWGLGPYAVDGKVEPDAYSLSHEDPPRLLETRIGLKDHMLVPREDGGVEDRLVAQELQKAPCLNEEQALDLAACAVRLEERYGQAQDIEWALDGRGRLFMLQTRPLRVGADRDAGEGDGNGAGAVAPGLEVLVSGGDTACPGVGFGPAWHVGDEDDLAAFPRGGVLVARHSSPKYVIVLPRASAVLTDAGSVTGHMASLTREFDVPAIFGLGSATSDVPNGAEITVDADNGRVYAGRADALLQAARPRSESTMVGTPVHDTLKVLAEMVVPLNLTDPSSNDFRPENCRTVHDLMRFMHEKSYSEMFAISDMAADRGSMAVKLKAPLPLDLYLIDLGGGLDREGGGAATPEHVASAPMAALLAGMLDPALISLEPRPVQLKGFMSVMTQQMLAPPPGAGGQRFGEKSYAIVSDTYVNFSSRVGYHYSVLDAYMGKTINENYVNFEFKGGAADDVRKNRRARSIAAILEALDFKVAATGDRVTARYQKYDAKSVRKRLEQVGRLLIFTRQMDMLMVDEASVAKAAEHFLAGDYHYTPQG